ncbi:MAG: hypothetical protein KGL39_20490 [Patescibacteria group bacterium]|nr:hypothetical protein [Patescibacteria group bacterium]
MTQARLKLRRVAGIPDHLPAATQFRCLCGRGIPAADAGGKVVNLGKDGQHHCECGVVVGVDGGVVSGGKQ